MQSFLNQQLFMLTKNLLDLETSQMLCNHRVCWLVGVQLCRSYLITGPWWGGGGNSVVIIFAPFFTTSEHSDI